MQAILTVLSAVLPVFCLAGTGVILRQARWLTAEADASLMRVVVNVLTPALIFDVVLGNAALLRPGNLFLAPLLGFLGVAVGVSVAWFLRRRSGLTDERSQRTFAAQTGIQNYGYVPLPLVLTLFPGDTAGVLFVHNLGVEIALWTVCLVALGYGSLREWRHLLSPPILAIVFAVGLNVANAQQWMPKFLLTTAQMLGACAFPLGIILIGATIADSAAELRQDFDWPTVVWASLVRLAILPALILGFAWLLPLSRELKEVLMVQAAMPAAVFPIVLARHFGGHPLTAVRIVVGTSALGFLTIPLWLKLGLWVIGPR